MAQNETSGPAVGQQVIYTEAGSVFYPAIVVSIEASGLVRLTVFAPGFPPQDKQHIDNDWSGQIPNTWRYPKPIEITQTISMANNVYVTEDGSEPYVTENNQDFYITES